MKHALMVCIGTAAFTIACSSSHGQSPGHASDQRTAAFVETTPAELTELASSVEAGGVVRARATALIASRVMSPIVDVRVQAGDRVRRGDVLVTLDARDLRAEDARARAATMSAAESVRAAEADVRAAESAVQLARLTHDRIATLQAQRSATTAELDQAVAARSAAEAQHAAAQARLAAAAAGRDVATAAAAAAGVTMTYATLSAPFDGIVTDRSAESGSMAAPGAPLLTLEDPTTYRLEVRLDETRAALVTPGGEAAIQLDGPARDRRDAPTTGRIVEIARVDPAAHSFLVKIALPPGLAVRSGQFGRASFRGAPRQAITVPSSSLLRRGQLTFVFVVDAADQRVHLRAVSTGAAADDRTEVLAGLRQGDRVVSSPGPALGEGDAVAGARP